MVTVSVSNLLLVFKTFDQRQDGDRLDCFAEAHLVGQDAIQVGLVKFEEPVEALELVLAEDASLDGVGLFLDLEYLNSIVIMIEFLHCLGVDGVADLVPLQRLPLRFLLLLLLVFLCRVHVKVVVAPDAAVLDLHQRLEDVGLGKQPF